MTHSHKHALIAITFTLCLTPACVELQPEKPDALVEKGGCSEIQCGSNSPSLGDYSAAEIHLDPGATVKGDDPADKATNLVNQDGLYLIEFFDPTGVPARYYVERDGELVIPRTGAPELRGAAVVGSKFFMGNTNAGEPDLYLTIRAYHNTIPYWIGAADNMHSYEMTYSPDPTASMSHSSSLCPGPYTDPTPVDPEYRDVVFSVGERYDFHTRRVFGLGNSAGWTNLSCLGDGPSKSLLYRHNPATPAADPYYTDWRQRQALRYMYAADFCGDGSVFTMQGHPLEYQDHAGWITANTIGATVEAVWGLNGPVCVDVPRWAKYTKADIEAECNKTFPSCSEPQFDNWEASYYFKSWNP